MLKYFSITFLLLASLQLFAQSEPCVVTQAPVIDGNGDEWGATWLEDEDKKFKYNICYDENNLYIRVKITDDMIQQKFAAFGFTVWLDPNGKKKSKLGLRFPTGVEAEERMEAIRKSGALDRKEMTAPEREALRKDLKMRMISNIEVMELIGLADDPLTTTRTGITNGLQVAIGMDAEENYTYEATIPFKSYRLVKAKIPVLGVGFETGKFKPKPSKDANNNAGGGMPGGGFGGGGYGAGGYGGYGGGYGGYGGGYGMRGPRSSGYSSSPMANTTKIWTSIKLNQ